ncbi:adenosylcobinamide-phosphate synthase CbiB [Clostridium hydrogeniformans]|uniref:adenosylcobinamide-phosphate synthase CbiB n=1 Tax=Clostridium hydrogeniformans TaxID=349933 RepID=UPI0004859501|nr:adenosylcobinamide-phosphate synthase CbiB [Clostridium hydrogeniformans]
MIFFIDLVIAVIIDFVVGDPYGFPHPIIYIGKLIRFLEKKGREIVKSNRGLKAYGGFIVVVVAFVTFIIPYGILYLLKPYKLLYHGFNILILWTTIAAKCLHVEGKKVYYSLQNNDIEDARLKLSYIVGRDTKNLTEEEIIRADVETIGENTSDGIIAPILYAMVGGAPLAMMYKGINTMDSTLGYMNEKYRFIGFFPAKIDDVFNYIPARLTGFLMCIISPIVKGDFLTSFKIMIRDRKNHKSPNCAYPEGALAGALRIQLGGTNVYFGEKIYKPTIGDKINPLNKDHINSSIVLMYGTEIILIVFYFILLIWFYMA